MGTYYNKTPIQAYKENGYPNLYLDFAGNKSLKDSVTKREDIVTFSRATEGTYFDADGILRIAATNSIFYSQQFETSNWIGTATSTILTNQTTAPDGTLTADKLVAGNEQSPVTNRVYQIGASINLKTVSVYAKAAEAEQIMIRYNNDDGSRYLVFSLIDGSLISSGSNNYDSYITEDVGNGWWRISVTSTPSNQSIAYFAVAGPTGLIGKGIYLWGAQLERGELTYYKPTGASFNSEPRFDHDPVTGESLGLLIEHSATKIRGGEVSGILFPQGSWGTGTGISTDILAPDGTSQTYKIVSPVLTSGQRTIDVTYFAINVTSGSYYVCSFYVYATGETPAARSFTSLAYGADIDTNLGPQFLHAGIIEDGVFTQISATSFQNVTFPKNKWVRYVVTFRAQSNCGASRLGYQVGLISTANTNYFAANSANIYIWGVQIESQSNTIGTGTPYLPTSYIYGSTGTRAQDFVTINGSNFTSFYNPSEFSIFSEFRSNLEYPAYSSVPEKNKFVNVYSIGSGGNRSAAVGENNPNPPLLIYRGSPALAPGYKDQYGFNKIVNVYNENTLTFSGSLNGAAEVSRTMTAAPSQSSITIGRLDGYPDTNLSGHLKKLVYWPQALPAGSLQTISKQGVDGFYTEKNIVTDGLLIHLDAANSTSYPGTGTTWYDLSGNGNNATLVGNPVYTQAPGYFDITSDSTYARITNTNLIPRTNDFTYSLWIKFDSFKFANTIFENGSWTDTLLFRYNGGNLNFDVYAENTQLGNSVSNVFNNLNMWYNIVFRRKAGIGKIFTNRMGNSREFIMTTDINLTNTNLFLMRSQHTTGQWVDGKISTFSIYNRALSDAEIEQNFSALRGRYGV